MISLKNLFLAPAFAVSALVLGQGTFTSNNFPQSYESHSSNIPKEAVAPEKLLSAKELVDINLNSMMNDPVLRNADWGFVIYDPLTKKIVNSYNENMPLIAASTTKLLTTETAISLLGTNFRWITQLEHSGTIDENGNLEGNLYIVGSGDPSLGTNKAGASSYGSIVSDFIYAISELGIKKVKGDIIIQTGVFKANKSQVLPQNIVWLEKGNYYLPAGSTHEINPQNERLIAKKSNPFSENKNYYYISPYIGQMVYADKFEGYPLTTKVADPPAYLANLLRTNMLKKGLTVSGKVVTRTTETNPEPRTKITEYSSPTLSEIVYYINQRSDNALSEATLRTIGFQKNGDQTLESGRNAVMEHLKSIAFDTNGLNYMDGSGLSRANVVTPIAQAKFLTGLMKEKHFKTYFDSLPVAGQSGTLKNTFQQEGYGQIFAKTGTLNKVKTLAGYMKTNTGKTLVFSLLINNYGGSVDMVKNRMEQILKPALNL